MRIPRWSCLVVITAFGSACTAAPLSPATTPSPVESSHPLATPSAVARARADSLRLPYTEADVAFMTGMIGHHAQAIQISRWAQDHGASPVVQRLAARIINSQEDEILTMQRWLAARGRPVPDAEAAGMMQHGEHGMTMPEMHMPGMLSMAQLTTLDSARGEEFDALFLRDMIQHHSGAVTMVETLFTTDGAAQDETAFKFANDVQVDQRTEIARMQRMLADILFRDGDS